MSSIFGKLHENAAMVPRVKYAPPQEVSTEQLMDSFAQKEAEAEVKAIAEEVDNLLSKMDEEDKPKVLTAVPSGNRLTITMDIQKPETKVESLEEAERMVLDMAMVQEFESKNFFALMRAANRIAACTRRGAGNLVLIAEGDDWGVTEGLMEVETHPAVEPDTAYVLYRTETEGPAMLISKDGDLYFSPLKSKEDFMCQGSDYIIKLVVK